MSSKLCPDCGAYAHRSRTRGLKEKIIRTLSSYRAYRCHECDWRGWYSKSKTTAYKNRNRLITVISVLITILITLLLAFYFIARLPPAVALPVLKIFS